MKTALITTTIYFPKVLELYRKIGPDVEFFVTGDKKTPHDKVKRFFKELGNAYYYDVKEQERLGYEVSDVIGWNTIRRRNIALLEALRHDADIIVTIDDDNIPMDRKYFHYFERLLKHPFSGMLVQPTKEKWFNVGEYFIPKVYHRGFPYELRHKDLGLKIVPITGKNIGVVSGMWLGDPDISAMERIINEPMIYQISEILQKGIIVEQDCYSPFNSQNTAYIRELAPLMMVFEGVGRSDDIWMAYVAERIMREIEYYVYYGKPYVWQERNPHNLMRNLKDEIYGMEWTLRFTSDLNDIIFGGGTIIDMLYVLYELLEKDSDYIPPIMIKQGKAWLKDLEVVV